MPCKNKEPNEISQQQHFSLEESGTAFSILLYKEKNLSM